MPAVNPADRLIYSRPFAEVVLAPLARWGQNRQRLRGATPRAAYSAMRKLYGCTSPAPFARLVAGAAAGRPAPAVSPSTGIAAGVVDETVAALRRDGYAVLPRRLDEPSCADLERTARAASCTLVGTAGGASRARFDDAAPIAVRYDVDEADVLESAAAQRLVADPSLLAVAGEYLGAAPIQDLVAMWWSTPVGGQPSSAAAQQYHFDLDRVRFVKVFVFLTDVDDRTGPHVFVRGSHQHKPARLRRDGRHADAEVAAAFPGEERRIAGPRGTVFLADTLGLHKGSALQQGHRLVFQTEYATSLFGAPFTRPVVAHPVPELVAMAERFPTVFQRFELGEPADPGS